MAKFSLLDVNVPKLFEDRSIEDIIELDRLLDAEIEKKRVELRSMVGDRYKDVLAATEAIKSMENISETIVSDIAAVKNRCSNLVESTLTETPTKPLILDSAKVDERIILVQIRLAYELNEFIWDALDDENFSQAAQYYLLAQHLHTGLKLFRNDIFEKYRVIIKIKETMDTLREKILTYTNNKLQTVELSTENTCKNLNALMLLESYSSNELLKKFIDLRKNALQTVIESTHPNVRAQIAAMVKCIYTTIHLLHDCFLNYKDTNKGLIWHQLDEIIGDDSPTTFSTLTLPVSNLFSYVPEVIKQFRPKCCNVNYTLNKNESMKLIQEWLNDTSVKIKNGVVTCLDLVPNVKGLHIIREEAFKIESPNNWDEICANTELPKNFNIWTLFQSHLTERAASLLTKKIKSNITEAEEDVRKLLRVSQISKENESDLRSYIWQEDSSDVDRFKHQHLGLSMKTKGFSNSIVGLCESFDSKFFNLLEDIGLYLYGVEYENGAFNLLKDKNKKFVDRVQLENHLKTECVSELQSLVSFLENTVNSNDENFVQNSIICARFLNAITNLCPNLNKCCCCNYSSDDWDKLCLTLNNASVSFWNNWIENCNVKVMEKSSQLFNDINILKMLSLICKWDSIEIQEQTNEKVFKSEIKVPMKCSVVLQEILDLMCELLNAVLPHTLPKRVHLKFLEKNLSAVLSEYETLVTKELNQTQALQFLFDVKFLRTFSIPKENKELVGKSHGICDQLRLQVDPFDLDVFYQYLQRNVKQSVLQSQVILGCLLPSPGQLTSLGVLEKNKEHEKDPSILALSTPASNNWFVLLPVTAPVQKTTLPSTPQTSEKQTKWKSTPNKKSDSTASVRSSAAALLGAATDWFS